MAALPLLAVILAAAAVDTRPAWALADWIGVEAYGFQNTPEGNASIDGGGLSGSSFDFQDTLGVDQEDTSTMAKVWFRWGKHNLSFDYVNPNHEGEALLLSPLIFNGTLFVPAQTLKTGMEMDLIQGRYRYHFVDLKVLEFGLGLGAHQATLKMDLEGSVTGQASLDESVPFVTLGAGVVIKPVPAFRIRIEGDGLAYDGADESVDFLDYRVQLELYVLHVLGFFAGYRSIDFDVGSENFGDAKLDYAGPYAGLGLKF